MAKSLDNGLLFPISPEEEDGKRKKPTKPLPTPRPLLDAAVHSDSPEEHDRFRARVDGIYACPQCGTQCLDLSDFRKVDGQQKWLVTCSWNCLISWVVDPVAGILTDETPEKAESEFVVRTGRYRGTFREIEAAGGLWYIQQLSRSTEKTVIADAAKKYLNRS